MKLKKYLIEKKTSLTGDEWKDKFIKQMNQWDKDIRQMMKLYKSLKADRSDLKNFLKAKKAFIIFGNNFEKWIYQDLLDKSTFGKDTESGFSSALRTSAWDTLHNMNAGSLFPMSYSWKTEKHEDSPEELDTHDGGRRLKIQRIQRSWRKTKGDIEDVITYLSDTLKEKTPDEQIQVSGVNIKIKNKTNDEWHEKYLRKFLKALPKAIGLVKKSGMTKAIRDFQVEINFTPENVEGIPGGLTAGAYDHVKDILYIFPLGLNDNLSDSTLVHEIGHRYWFKFIPENAKNAWKKAVESKMITVKKEHLDTFFDLYFNREYGTFQQRRKIIAHAQKNISDPTLLAVIKYFAEHHPVFDTGDRDAEETYKEWMWKRSREEQIPIEWITDYGRTNDKEAFAEAFKLWVGGVKGKLGEWTRAWFKNIVSKGGANIKENKLIDKYLGEKNET